MANVLTILRVLLIPIFVYAWLSPIPSGRLVATAVFGAAALTDLFDGMIARKTGTVSDIGRMMDPLADRILVASVLALLVYTKELPLIAVLIVVMRDLALIVGYELLKAKGGRPEVSFLGKVSTATLMVAVALVMLGAPGGRVVFYAGVALSIVSGVAYALGALRRLAAEGRQ